jgi:ankyrin repeat protein
MLQQMVVSPLHLATMHERCEVVRELVHLGAKVDFTDRHGATPFFLAAQLGEIAIMRELAEHGANVDHMQWQVESHLSLSPHKTDA